MTPLSAFLIGLTTGGLTCLAVQGGLLLGLLAHRTNSESNQPSRWWVLAVPVVAFLVAKLFSHTLLGFGLGWLGESIQLSVAARLWLQTIAGVFMLVAGVRLIFPGWLSWLNVTPPASVRRLVRRSARSEMLVAPAILGFLTILIPCGTTQAMEVAAVASGSAWLGASLMFSFVLGTAPLFFLVGVLAKGSALLQRQLSYAAAVLVIGLGLYSINGVLIAVDSPLAIKLGGTSSVVTNPGQGQIQAETSPIISVLNNGYQPATVRVPAGRPVRLRLETKNIYSCTSVFTIPKLQVMETLPPTGTTVVTATFPKPGEYTFSCGMGMYWGKIIAT